MVCKTPDAPLQNRALLRDTGVALPVWPLRRVRHEKTARDVQYKTVRRGSTGDAKM